jgi:hypothetical protein
MHDQRSSCMPNLYSNNEPYDYVMKTDDDSYIILPQIRHVLRAQDTLWQRWLLPLSAVHGTWLSGFPPTICRGAITMEMPTQTALGMTSYRTVYWYTAWSWTSNGLTRWNTSMLHQGWSHPSFITVWFKFFSSS